MQKTIIQNCESCRACQKLYRIYDGLLWDSEFHFCAEQEKTTALSGCCEFWQPIPKRFDLSLQRMDNAIEDTFYLIKVLSESTADC